MSLVVTYEENTGGGSWENAPIGIHKSTCCDVVDLGIQETEHGPKHQCEIHFELDKETAGMVEATGKQFTVRTKRFNLPEKGRPLSEKSNLFKFLCSWKGKPIPAGQPIDLEKLIGAQVTLVLATSISKNTGNEYTSIDSLTPKRKDEIFPPLSGEYTRRKDRDDAQPAPVPAPVQPAPAPAPVSAANLEEDDVPF
jgi:hypothetical protein